MSKIEQLKNKLDKLKKYKTELNQDNVSEFEKLVDEISELLNVDKRIRFNKLDFYEEEPEGFTNDDLPF